jgi:glycerol-3-phosphate cytidylyltransferase-like family protein
VCGGGGGKDKMKIEKIENSIVLLFLEKLEIMTMEERKEILESIRWINKPIFVCSNDKIKKNK